MRSESRTTPTTLASQEVTSLLLSLQQMVLLSSRSATAADMLHDTSTQLKTLLKHHRYTIVVLFPCLSSFSRLLARSNTFLRDVVHQVPHIANEVMAWCRVRTNEVTGDQVALSSMLKALQFLQRRLWRVSDMLLSSMCPFDDFCSSSLLYTTAVKAIELQRELRELHLSKDSSVLSMFDTSQMLAVCAMFERATSRATTPWARNAVMTAASQVVEAWNAMTIDVKLPAGIIELGPALYGKTRAHVRNEEHITPAVELVWKLGGAAFALRDSTPCQLQGKDWECDKEAREAMKSALLLPDPVPIDGLPHVEPLFDGLLDEEIAPEGTPAHFITYVQVVDQLLDEHDLVFVYQLFAHHVQLVRWLVDRDYGLLKGKSEAIILQLLRNRHVAADTRILDILERVEGSTFAEQTRTIGPKAAVAKLTRTTRQLYEETVPLPAQLLRVYASDSVATYLTIIDRELYEQLTPSEFHFNAWTDAKRRHRAPNILKCIKRVNELSFWVSSSILWQKTAEDRAYVITKALDLMKELHKRRNYSSLIAIGASLRSSAVYRLKKTMQLLSEEQRQTLEQYGDLIGSPAVYRESISQELSDSGAIPYIGNHLTDIFKAHDANKLTEHGLLNSNYLKLMVKLLKGVLRFQTQFTPKFPASRAFRAMLSLPFAPEDELYSLSLQAEPRESK